MFRRGCQIVLGLLLCGIACEVTTVMSQTPPLTTRRSQAQKLQSDGNFADALVAYRELCGDPKNDGREVAADLIQAVQCLGQLGRITEFDSLAESTVAAHPQNWRLLQAAAEQFVHVDHHGFLVSGKFQRGPHRGAGEQANSVERDRVRALQLMLAARPLAQVDNDKGEVAEFFLALGRHLVEFRGAHEAWRLQYLTEFTTLPDNEEGYAHFMQSPGAPVDEQGNPVYYPVPKTWEAAKNDGQRWRWALEQAVENSPRTRNAVRTSLAQFCQQQFGVETLSSGPFGFPWPREHGDDIETKSGIFSLHTLADDETIARLASGIKRFKLPDEFNAINIYQQIADEPQTGHGEHALDELAKIFANRRQFPRAASFWKRSIELYGTGTNNRKKEQFDQILGNWGRFEATATQSAGQGASFDFVFRNTTEVTFEAWPINVDKLLTDVKNYIKSNPRELDWERAQIDNIGFRIVQRNTREHLGTRVATWTETLKPREGHFNTRASITSPLRTAGAYFVTAQIKGGNTCHMVLWVADTAIIKKPMEGKTLYYVGDASSGAPVAKANVEYFGWKVVHNRNARPILETKSLAEGTNDSGLISLDLRAQPGDYQWLTIARTSSGRLAYLGFHNVWTGSARDQIGDQAKAFVITDRPVYRPGQTVQYKVWVRRARYDVEGTREFTKQEFAVELHDPQQEKISATTITTDEYAGANGKFVLPNDAKLGVYNLQIPGYGGLSFRVEEYKKPEFEVLVQTPDEPAMLGEVVRAKIQAKYYFGSPVANGTVKYKVLRKPPDGDWFPLAPWDWCYGPGYWWFGYDYTWYPGWSNWAGCLRPMGIWWPRPQHPPEVVAEREVPLNELGEVEVLIDTTLAKEIHGDKNQQYEITAEVRDASRRTIVGQGKVLVASQPFKVYAWLDRGYYRTGDTMEAHFHAQTMDHKPVTGQGKLRLMRVRYRNNQTPEETTVQEWSLNTNKQGESQQKLTAGQPGQYRLSYQLTDAQNHTIEGGYVFTIVGTGFDGREFRYNDLELIPDKSDYQPDEKVQLQINTNRADSTVLLFVRPVNGVYATPKVLRLKGKSVIEELAVIQRDMPNFFVEAMTISNGEVRTEIKEIVVPPEKRILTLSVLPSKEIYRPGEKGKMKLQLTDLTGESFVGSTVLAIYDKSVEYISGGSNVQDIKKFFWSWRRYHHPHSDNSLSRSSYHIPQPNKPDMHPIGIFGETLVDGDEEGMPMFNGGGRVLARGRKAFGAAGMGGALDMAGAPEVPAAMAAPGGISEAFHYESPSETYDGSPNTGTLIKPTVRSNFVDTAVWVGWITTSKTGQAEIDVTMPENLTTWKIRAWGMGHGTRVGSAESEVVTRKNLIVRLQAPRFLVQNDLVVLSANVHNYLSSEKEVRVTLEVPGEKLEVLDSLTTVVRIPANGEKRVDWRAKVVSEGSALIRMKALTDEESDAMEMLIPCHVHGILKTESWAGTVRPDKESATVSVRVPKERRVPQSLLEVRFSPSLAASMVDALPYLVDYPYGCTEQTLNRFLPTVITQKILREMNLNLGEIQDKRTNLNAQEIGDDAARAKQWKRLHRNPVFDVDEVHQMVKEGVTRLTNMQLSDGGWGWFSGFGEHSYPHTTAVVVHGLQVARENDVAIVPGVVEKGVDWLSRYQQQQVELLDCAARKLENGKPWTDNLDAMVYMVLVDAGVDNASMREYLYRDRTKLSVYGNVVLGMALFKVKDQTKFEMVMRNLSQFLVEDPENETAFLRLSEDSPWWAWYGSDIEANAYYLKLLARTNPQGQTAARLVKYLLNNRKHSTYWRSTRDTALCVEAFAEFIRGTGEAQPNMTVEIWMDGSKRKEVAITGENLFQFDNRLVVEGTDLSDGNHQIEIRRRGSGSVYFNAYLTNFSLEDPITKAGLEVKVQRQYYRLIPVDKQTKVAGKRGQAVDQRVEKYERELLAMGDAVKSGDLLEIELEIESKNDYEYLLFEDWKAAGLEPFDVRSGYNSQGLPAYMELRDDRISLLLRTLPRGKHSLRYRMRAETPGTFSALPTQASAMYAPELRGNSDEHKLKINDL